jgi:hypothetical protein
VTLRVRAWLAVMGGGLLAGCAVGSGSGSAEGELFQYGCIHDNGPDAGADTPRAYNLAPVFFAGEPIEDLSVTGMHSNEMRIRMQNNGLSIQYADTLYFDVVNSYEVARCLRGRIDDHGQPDWNVTEPLPDGSQTGWCDWSGTQFADGSADGGGSMDGGMSVMASAPRIHLTPYTDVRSSFATLSTCGITNVTAVAFDGWITFQYFGAAEQPELSPDKREAVDRNFVIQYGDRMRATFHVVLGDQIVITSKQMNLPPPRPPEIGGTLDGYFDFNLERGRSAQPFP